MYYAFQISKKYTQEVPVYSLILNKEGKIIAESPNLVNKIDVTAHAEKNVMLQVAHHEGYRNLSKYILLSTLEPCDMCQEICRLYCINQVYFSAYNPLKQYSSPRSWIGGILLEEGSQIIKKCFLNCRKGKIK